MLRNLLRIWHAQKYTFEQHLPGEKPFAPLAQLAEQLTLNQRVAGSIPARCILRPVQFADGLASPTWNASVPFLVRGSGADMNSVVSYFTEDISLQIITTELATRVAIQKTYFAGNIIK